MNPTLARLKFPARGILAESLPWFEAMLARNYRPSTVRFLFKSLEVFTKFITRAARGARLRNTTSADIQAYKAELIRRKLAAATLENYLQTVKSYFNWLEATGAIFENPARNFRVPRKFRRMQNIFSEADLARLLDSIDGDTPKDQLDRALFEIAYGSGLRLDELTRLMVSSLDLVDGTVRVFGKGAKERIVPLTKKAVRAVKAYLHGARTQLLRGCTDESALWIGATTGRALTAGAVARRIVVRAQRAGFDLSAHDLRRAFATHLLLRGVSPAILKELLGHATYSHLKEYLRYAPMDLIAIHRRCRPGK